MIESGDMSVKCNPKFLHHRWHETLEIVNIRGQGNVNSDYTICKRDKQELKETR